MIKENLETINLYRKLILNSKGTIRESQCGFYRYEIKKLLLENYELATRDIKTNDLTTSEPKKVYEAVDEIWMNSSDNIFKFASYKDLTTKQLETEEQYCIDNLYLTR